MKLNFAILCDNAFTDKEGRLNVIQKFERIYTDRLPTTYPRVTVVTNFFINEEERDKEYIQTLEIKKDGSSDIILTTNQISVTPIGDVDYINYINYINALTFDSDGVYKIFIKINGGVVGETSLLVKKNDI